MSGLASVPRPGRHRIHVCDGQICIPVKVLRPKHMPDVFKAKRFWFGGGLISPVLASSSPEALEFRGSQGKSPEDQE